MKRTILGTVEMYGRGNIIFYISLISRLVGNDLAIRRNTRLQQTDASPNSSRFKFRGLTKTKFRDFNINKPTERQEEKKSEKAKKIYQN